MILKRFYDEPLAQASYLVGCPGAGEAVIIDPNRDVQAYIEAAAAEGLRITAVTETHIHADYASGSLELAERTGATLYLSDEGDNDWKYAFADRPFVKLVKDGDAFKIGALRFDIVHTPGHTPEHITIVLTDEAANPDPCCAFTGDFLFAGDVGRPDLLERAAGFEGTMERGAGVLFNTIQKFRRFPAHMLIWPAHGAGSACGKSLGGVPVSTLGYEIATNWAFAHTSESSFVQDVLAGQPDPPVYFKEMKRLNKEGAATLGTLGAPTRLGDGLFMKTLEQALVVDTRSAAEAALGLIPGTYNIPIGKSFTNWAGWLLSYNKPIAIIANNEADAAFARRALATIGLDNVIGWFGLEVLKTYKAAAGSLERIDQIGAEVPLENVDSTVLDVRANSEWNASHIEGSLNIPLGQLEKRIAEVPNDKPIIVHCAGGLRSSMAASVLVRNGHTNVTNLIGGFGAYSSARKK